MMSPCKIFNKGADAARMIEMGKKLRASGIKLSITVLLGIGGKERSHIHARETGRVLTAIDPEYVGALSLMLTPDTPLYEAADKGRIHPAIATRRCLKNLPSCLPIPSCQMAISMPIMPQIICRSKPNCHKTRRQPSSSLKEPCKARSVLSQNILEDFSDLEILFLLFGKEFREGTYPHALRGLVMQNQQNPLPPKRNKGFFVSASNIFKTCNSYQQ